jgi:hypothetical protein
MIRKPQRIVLTTLIKAIIDQTYSQYGLPNTPEGEYAVY